MASSEINVTVKTCIDSYNSHQGSREKKRLCITKKGFKKLINPTYPSPPANGSSEFCCRSTRFNKDGREKPAKRKRYI